VSATNRHVHPAAPAWKRGGGTIILTEAIPPPPRGRAALSGWAHIWWRRQREERMWMASDR
jgi:hypothetical protein